MTLYKPRPRRPWFRYSLRTFFVVLTVVPKLKEHLGGVVAVMKLSDSWADFTYKLNRLYPYPGETLLLPFNDLEEDDGKGL